MAAGAFTLFNIGKARWFDSTFDWDGTEQTVFYARLLKQPYTLDATDSIWSDVSAQVVTDGDYAGELIAAGNMVVNGGTSTATGNLDYTTDIDFGPSVTITAKWMVIAEGTATTPQAGDKLLGVVDLNTASATAVVSSTNGDFKITPHANGFFTFA